MATTWDVRATGNDSNAGGYAGGGVDSSQRDTPLATCTDLAIASGNSLQVSSSTIGFIANHVGNYLNITAGTGFTAGRRLIVSVSGGIATLDAAAGTVSSSGGSARLGGALASPGFAASLVGLMGTVDTVYIKAGNYVCTNTPNVAGGRPQPAVTSRWIGYTASRGDATPWGTMPSLKAGASGMTIFTVAANDVSVENLEFDGQAPTFTGAIALNGTAQWRARAWNCRAINTGGDGFAPNPVLQAHYCEAVNCGGFGFTLGGGLAMKCLARGCAVGFRSAGAGVSFDGCVAYSNAGDGFTDLFAVSLRSCLATNNGGNGFTVDNPGCVCVNSAAWSNAGNGFGTTGPQYDVLLIKCAGGANTGGDVHATDIPNANITGFITLTADPSTSVSTFNYALNSTAGGGAALRGAGFGQGPGAGTIGYPDIGAAQHQDAGGSGPTLSQITAGVVAAMATAPVGSVTGNVGGNVVGSTGSVTGSVASVTTGVTVGAYATGQDPATLILAASVESGETVLQYFRKLRAIVMGIADRNTTPGSTIFRRKDGATASITIANDTAGNRTAVTDGTN